MGRPPSSGAHAFRFFPKEVQEMEKFLEDGKGAIPPRDTISSLAEKFSAAPERAGKILVQWKQVWTWFQNRRYAQKAKGTKVPGNPAPAPRDDSGAKRIVTNSAAVPSGRKVPGASEMEFEAKSARDGAWGKQNYVLKFADYANPLIWFNYLFLAAHKHAGWKSTGFLKGLHHSWDSSSQQSTSKGELTPMPNNQGIGYDVASFVTHRMFESGDPLAELMPLSVSAEVRVRFAGFGAEEDEWVNVKNCVRQRSLPCEASECVAVLSGDLILCFQEGKEQALYFDAHVLDAQRRRHDARGCRCRFLVRYDHDQSEEIVPLSKICRRPETDYRLQLVHVSKELSSIELDHGSQQIKDAPAAPICHFGAATQEELHLSPEISKNTSQVVEENVQSLTAPKTSVLQEQEGLSAESQTNLFATEINTSQKIVAPAFIDMDKASNSMVDTTAKSKVQD